MDKLSGSLRSENESTPIINLSRQKGLWHPTGFLVISVLFSFLPAAVLYCLNYGRMGLPKQRNIRLAISFLVFIAMVSLTFLTDQALVKSLFYAANISFAIFMRNDQLKTYKDFVDGGGRKASYILPVIICLIISAGLIWSMFYSSNIPEEKLMFNGSELYYTNRVYKDEAQKLGTYLSKNGFFTEARKVSVKIDKQSNTYKFSLIVDKDKIEDQEVQQFAKDLGHDLSYQVFNYNKVDINLCDDVFKPLKTISQ